MNAYLVIALGKLGEHRAAQTLFARVHPFLVAHREDELCVQCERALQEGGEKRKALKAA
ncbi:MAG: hypothetical protein AB7P69_23200 [Candidatus Binatia bacterium]